MNKKIDELIQTMEKNFELIHKIYNEKNLNLNDDYKRINHTYYLMVCSHYESFFILIKSNHFSSAILLLRTMLELCVKSYYLEFIEKEKKTEISGFLDDIKKFPEFFDMAKKLEIHTDKSGAKFNGTFKQFTRAELASYQKFSLFTHGKGEYLKAIFTNNKLCSYKSEQILEILENAKFFFEALALLFFYTQGFNNELKDIVAELKKV